MNLLPPTRRQWVPAITVWFTPAAPDARIQVRRVQLGWNTWDLTCECPWEQPHEKASGMLTWTPHLYAEIPHGPPVLPTQEVCRASGQVQVWLPYDEETYQRLVQLVVLQNALYSLQEQLATNVQDHLEHGRWPAVLDMPCLHAGQAQVQALHQLLIGGSHD